jgi:hypothetical protein
MSLQQEGNIEANPQEYENDNGIVEIQNHGNGIHLFQPRRLVV